MDGILFSPALEHTHYMDSLFLSQVFCFPPGIPEQYLFNLKEKVQQVFEQSKWLPLQF